MLLHLLVIATQICIASHSRRARGNEQLSAVLTAAEERLPKIIGPTQRPFRETRKIWKEVSKNASYL